MSEELQKIIDSIPEVKSQEQANLENIPEWTGVKQVFAKKSTVRRNGGRIYGCFNDSFSGACDETEETSIQASAVIFSQGAGNCDTGGSVTIYTIS
jgi:hypothetical protein